MHSLAATQSSERLAWKLQVPGALAAAMLAFAVLWLCWQQRVPMASASIGRAAPTQWAAAKAGDVRFESNRGQLPSKVRYQWRGAAQRVSILDDGMAFTAWPQRGAGDVAATVSSNAPSNATINAPSTAQLRFVGARTGGSFSEREPLTAKSHHLRGADPARWLRDLPQFKQLRYAEIYPGIDLVYYGREGSFEFDLVVRPGADPARIRLQAQGGKGAFVESGGDLLLDGQGGVLRVHKPVLFQHIDGQRVTLDAQWVLGDNGELSFALPDYDRRYPLVIDPVFKLLYSTYLGGVHDDIVNDMVMDAQGNAYVVGHSGSEDWPVSGNAVQTRRKNIGVYVRNVVVTKFDAAGTLIWSTFLGGSVNDYGTSIAIDAAGNVVVAGATHSPDFPTTPGALQSVLQEGSGGFIATLSPDGSSLVQSTLVGGAGRPSIEGMALDSAGNIVVSGTALPGLVTTAGVYKPTLATGKAAFVARYAPTVAGPLQLLAASYYGTDTPENNSLTAGNVGFALALDVNGAPWISGGSYTTRLPLTANALQAAPTALDPNCSNGVVPLNSFGYLAKLSPDLKTLQYASYLTGYTRAAGLGACNEYALSVRVDAAGDVYVHGATASDRFPTTAGTAQASYPGRGFRESYAAFVTKIKGDGSRVLWSTYLGGNAGNTFAGRTKLDATNAALWVPMATSGGSNFPITADALQKVHGGGTFDAAYVQLDTATGTVKYSTFMGGAGDDIGIAVGIDPGGNAFVAGHSNSRNLSVTTNAFQAQYTVNAFDGNDWFVRVLGSATIGSPRPARGGNTGDVSVSMSGAGLESITSAELVGQGQTIVAASISALANADLTATFALEGALPGKYAVVLRSLDGITTTKADAFEIFSGGKPEVGVTIIGRSKIRNNTPATFNINVANTGSVDAYFQTLWISFPSDVQFQLKNIHFISETNISVPGSDDSDGRHYIGIIVPRIEANSSYSLELVITDSVGNRKLDVQAYLKFPWFASLSEATTYFENLVQRPDSLGSGCVQTLTQGILLNNCFAKAVDQTYSRVSSLVNSLNESNPTKRVATYSRQDITKAYATDLLAALRSALARVDKSAISASRKAVLSASDLGDKRPQVDVIKFVEHVIFGTDFDSEVMKFADAMHKGIFEGIHREFHFVKTKTRYSLIGGCAQYQITETWCNIFTPYDCHDYSYRQSVNQDPPGWKPKPNAGGGSCSASPSQSANRVHVLSAVRPSASGDSCPEPPNDDAVQPPHAGQCSESAGAMDPNDKSGPTGDGSSSHWLRQARSLQYQIAFENQPSATLPAADVVVSDQINTTKFDLSTLTLGNISWGPYRVDVPAGLNSYSTIFPINSSMSVRIQGSLNPTSGLLKWTFSTLDPITKLPPSDPTLGFLPPNKNGTEGQGYVNFSIAPKAGLPEGVRWENAASIVFDTNAPIATPTWVNTLDSTAPVSHMASAAQKATTTEVDVAWSGTDAGSGVAGYTVKVSDNGGAFADWQTGVVTTSAVYPGVAGHTYGFTVAATDKAGNAESARLTSDMTVSVKDPTAPPVTPPSGGGGGCTIAGGDSHDAGLLLMVLAALTLVWRRREGSKPVEQRS